ncbi:hypothetical protein EJ04DRAFT_452106 [Polyplosphaeria fusca]|uniref:Uncharacterized protein n=1 Tax=Polyplosphaeria fusca TaxID=682080 RepID=A0A9P4UVN8_9PLEO|nr:hypothetical protein EJ04DRAFT_452106 [Polyplosphaeria fusca]
MESEKVPTLGPLALLKGTFISTGFNQIFRPKSKSSKTKFKNAITSKEIDDNIMQLNLTSEVLTFFDPLGEIPNRGFDGQPDTFLNGIPYTQQIKDATNVDTGKGDLPGERDGIHFETGIWLFVPASTDTPKQDAELVRMASIPHGTTISARGPAKPEETTAAPSFKRVDITPTAQGRQQKPSQDVGNASTSRLPQDLKKFVDAGTITDAILKNPNTVLQNANEGKDIKQTISFSVTSNVPLRDNLGRIDGDGDADITNIPFLRGPPLEVNVPEQGSMKFLKSSNALVTTVTATLWISTVASKITVPAFTADQQPILLKPVNAKEGAPTPVFRITPDRGLSAAKTVTVFSSQIQYSQNVVLRFRGIDWPHVSVATLVPKDPIDVPASALK